MLTAVAGMMPAAVAWLGKLEVDAIVVAAFDGRIGVPSWIASGLSQGEPTRVVIILVAALLGLWVADRAIVVVGRAGRHQRAS